MTPIKRNLNYFIRQNGLLRARVSWNRLRYEISLGVFIDRTDAKGKPKWDGRRCRNSTTHGPDRRPAYAINTFLQDFEDRIEALFYEFESLDIVPTVDDFKGAYSGARQPGKEREKSVAEAFDEFLQEGRDVEQWAANTYKKFRTIKKLLLKFNPRLAFSDVNASMMRDLMAFQTTHAVHDRSEREAESGKSLIKYRGSYQNETINRNMRLVKWFFRWCHGRRYIDSLDFREARTTYRTARKPIVFLEWNELMSVLHHDFSARPELDRTRDMFCFCCFTSLRYSDMINLKWGDVSDDCIRLTTVKTTDRIVIDLNDYSRAILKKYAAEGSRPTDPVFREKSSQKMNMRLKEIARICGIDAPVSFARMTGAEREDITVPKYELVTTHCGRRTFISNAISMGIPPSVVMKWTGHSDYKAMQPYIEIADETRREAMGAFNRPAVVPPSSSAPPVPKSAPPAPPCNATPTPFESGGTKGGTKNNPR